MPNKSKKKDPHYEREAKKYAHPVPSREIILEFLGNEAHPCTLKQLLSHFHIRSDEEKEGIRRRLGAMIRAGQIMANRRGQYATVKGMELVAGRVQGHRDGYGFLIAEDGGSDVFLPARQMRGLFTDDRVLVRIIGYGRGDRREGAVVEVLERNTHQVAGRLYKEDGIYFVDPDDKRIVQDIIVAKDEIASAKPNQFVVVEITQQPSARHAPQGRVVEVLGDHLTPGMETELAIRAHEIAHVWPEAVKQEVKIFPSTVTKEAIKGRRDLRDLPFVTIDGEDARDFDDAVFSEQNKKGWRLYVAIADVTHYLKPGTALNAEAESRGNSVYFPARVIPMLPEVLSNELCSLKPNEDRLVMVCEMDIDHQGHIKHYEFYESVIHSQARLTYNQVADMLDGNHNALPQKLHQPIKTFHALYKILLNQREQRGAIEFDSVETKIVFDDKGKIACIEPRKRNEAHRMIEEAMLAANVCAASFLENAKIQTLYRIHETPDEQKLSNLRDFLKVLGLRLMGGNKPHAKDYGDLLKRTRQRVDAHLIQTVCLRSMRQAVYSPENKGHFGLAYEHYAHFTSPIRRYPDVVVHRGLKFILNCKKSDKFMYTEEVMQEMGEHFSMTERRADEATRDATDWLKCEFMLEKVGETFEGIIVEVTGFGLFVELKEIYVTGLLHVTSLSNDYYHYDPIHYRLEGKRSGKVYRLGDPIHIVVARVNLDDRQIDFNLVETNTPRQQRKKEKS